MNIQQNCLHYYVARGGAYLNTQVKCGSDITHQGKLLYIKFSLPRYTSNSLAMVFDGCGTSKEYYAQKTSM